VYIRINKKRKKKKRERKESMTSTFAASESKIYLFDGLNHECKRKSYKGGNLSRKYENHELNHDFYAILRMQI
jgi:hypothetical protein